MERDCMKCIHKTTPKRKTCYTMTRRLDEELGDKPFIPVHVIPIMNNIANTCKRYEVEE